MGKVMRGMSLKSLRYYKSLFLGSFVTMTLGIALIGMAVLAVQSTLSVPPVTNGPAVTLPTDAGDTVTFYRDAVDMQGITTILVLTAVVSGFMTISIISSTFAFAIALRKRDIGLLRLLGMASGQVTRMVLGEALALAAAAAAVGCAIAVVMTPGVLHLVNQTPLTPVALPENVNVTPLFLVYILGVLLAVLAVLLAARRAARVHPIEALREAALDSGVMTKPRWLIGGIALIVGLVMLILSPGAGAVNSTPLAIFGTIILTVAAIMLAPAYQPLLVKLASAAIERIAPISGRLAAASTYNARRRTSILVAPILSILAVVGIMIGVMTTSVASDSADQVARTHAQIAVVSRDKAGLSQGTLQNIQTLPGVKAVSAQASIKIAFATDAAQSASSNQSDSLPGHTPPPLGNGFGPPEQTLSHGGSGLANAGVVDLTALAQAQEVHAVEGALAPLSDNEIAVRKEFISWYGVHAGSTMHIGFFDGRVIDAKVAAVLDGGNALPQVLLSPALADAQAAPAAEALVVLHEPAQRAAVISQTNRLLSDTTGEAMTIQAWHQRNTGSQDKLQQLALVILAVPASAFVLVAICNNLIMAFSRRKREFATMLLMGVKRGQMLRMVVVEAILAVVLGLIVALPLVFSALAGYWTALSSTTLAASLAMPWQVFATLALACLSAAIIASLVIVGKLFRRPSISLLASREM
jgi:putative ABC transport system permease protein